MRRTLSLPTAFAVAFGAIWPASAFAPDHPARPASPVVAMTDASCLETSRLAAVDAGLSKGWSPNRRTAYARLLVAADAFARAVARHETDHGGTADDCGITIAEAAERHVFHRTLDAIVADPRARTSPMNYREADSALNAAYGEVMAVEDPQNLAWGSVDKSGIRAAERAWLAYRDAFVGFAATFDAPGVAEQIAIELTMRRTASLEAFLAD